MACGLALNPLTVLTIPNTSKHAVIQSSSTECVLQAREDGKGGQPGSLVRLIGCHLYPDAAEREGEAAVTGQRRVTGDEGPVAPYPHPREAYFHAEWQLDGAVEFQSHRAELVVDVGHVLAPSAKKVNGFQST